MAIRKTSLEKNQVEGEVKMPKAYCIKPGCGWKGEVLVTFEDSCPKCKGKNLRLGPETQAERAARLAKEAGT